MSNLSTKLSLVLAQILIFAVVFLAIVSLSSSIYIKPNEVGVATIRISDKLANIQTLKPGLHAWPFEKDWIIFSTKVAVFNTDLQKVCVEDVRVFPLVKSDDQSLSYHVSVCAMVTLNPDTIDSFHFKYYDREPGLSAEQMALGLATIKATTFIPNDFFEDRVCVADAILEVLNHEMRQFGDEPMMSVGSVTVERITIQDMY